MSSIFDNTEMSCMPAQVAQLDLAVNSISDLQIYKCENCVYDTSNVKVSWSYDGVNWTCFNSFSDVERATVDAKSDFYVKLKVNGVISDVTDGDDSVDYTTSIDAGIQTNSCSSQTYNPYSGLTSALALQQSLVESVSCMIGIPIYYFKLAPNVNSKDITFKEYTLMNIEAVKQIKLIITDGTMPSSKPEFSDFGMDWQTDWETEITKSTFATAFGTTAQPMEGDLVYIPMMKRMWMVNEAYDEKNGSLMWNSTTWKVSLVKYQEKGSVDLGDMQDTVDSFVKNKYEDLFGDEEGLDSGVEAVDQLKYNADNLYPVYESDATRKYITSEGTTLVTTKLYQRGTQVSDMCYKFDPTILSQIKNKVVYQRKYCGDTGTASLIIGLNGMTTYDTELLNIGGIVLRIKMTERRIKLMVDQSPSSIITLPVQTSATDNHYFIWLRWSKQSNIVELGASEYSYNESIPLYKLQPAHYRFDLDNPIASKVCSWNMEMMVTDKQDIIMNGIPGTVTNIKVYDIYVNNLTEVLQQYPNNQHLLVNDTARKVIDMLGGV